MRTKKCIETRLGLCESPNPGVDVFLNPGSQADHQNHTPILNEAQDLPLFKTDFDNNIPLKIQRFLVVKTAHLFFKRGRLA